MSALYQILCSQHLHSSSQHLYNWTVGFEKCTNRVRNNKEALSKDKADSDKVIAKQALY